MRKYWIAIIVIISVFLLIYVFRYPLLRQIGKGLMYEDELEQVDALFVLGGGALHRGNEAVKIYNDGFAPYIYCTSGNFSQDLESLGIRYYESEISRMNIVRQGIPEESVVALRTGTSTAEESDTILNFCKANQIESCIVLSSRFHTGRVKSVFKNKFEDEGIKIIIRGAPSLLYDEANWWKDERGLIMVNNEYVKKLYYLVKY